ncbi:hypothetical protein D9M71_639930 [compost metagenome]
MPQSLCDVKTCALSGQIDACDAVTGAHIDKRLVHLALPTGHQLRIRWGGRQAPHFLDAGLDQILATDRATVGQLQRKRHIRALRITGKQARAPQLRAVDRETEYAHLPAPHPTRIGQGLAPISKES